MLGQIDNLVHSLNEGMNHSAPKDLKAWMTTKVSDYTVLPFSFTTSSVVKSNLEGIGVSLLMPTVNRCLYGCEYIMSVTCSETNRAYLLVTEHKT